jgi:hypothetical protein
VSLDFVLITQTAPIFFTAPRYPVLIDSEFRTPSWFAAWIVRIGLKRKVCTQDWRGAHILWSGLRLCESSKG